VVKRSEQEDKQPGTNGPAATSQLDRLERLANAAATAAQAKQWRARKNGLDQQEEPSEVRNLSYDAEARAQAKAAMQQMMAQPKGSGDHWIFPAQGVTSNKAVIEPYRQWLRRRVLCKKKRSPSQRALSDPTIGQVIMPKETFAGMAGVANLMSGPLMA
jgi:hypothetical protein